MDEFRGGGFGGARPRVQGRRRQNKHAPQKRQHDGREREQREGRHLHDDYAQRPEQRYEDIQPPRHRHQEQPGRKREIREMGYRRLEELDKGDAQEILFTLVDNGSGFRALLESKNIKPAITDLMLSVIRKALACSARANNRNTLMNKFRTSNFISATLPNYITGMTVNRSVGRMDKYRESMRNLVAILTQLLEVMPSSLVNVLPIIATLHFTILRNNATTGIIDEELRLQVMELYHLQCSMVGRLVSESKGPRDVTAIEQDQQPPDDFRDLPIFPDLHEIQPNEKPFLRANKATGQFDDLDHYLDIQFRLLREDFLRPLRNGIAEYLHSLSHGRPTKKLQNIRVYHGVYFANPVCTPAGIAYRIRFDVSRLGYVRWECTKRLLYGSLVCLSSDDFQTMIFGTVYGRDALKLAEGELVIRVEHSQTNASQIPANCIFVMAETSAYFEAYRHVLQGIQNTGNVLPFQKYLVKCTTQTDPPQYARGKPNLSYDFRCLIEGSRQEKNEETLSDNESDLEEMVTTSSSDSFAKAVPLLNKSSWPDENSMGLDGSQFRALHAALTREFAIIQGPPGTGKTFLGLKVVETLLRNKQQWCSSKNESPILVVCYTNHALDQFLEGITKFCKDGIVRVGGRSRSQVLEKYYLRNLRMEYRESKQVQKAVYLNRMDAIREMETMETNITKTTRQIEKTEQGIVREEILEEFMTMHHYQSLLAPTFPSAGCEILGPSVLCEWLGLYSTVLDNAQEAQKEFELEEDEDIEIEEDAAVVANQRILEEDIEDILRQLKPADAEEDQENSLAVLLDDLLNNQVRSSDSTVEDWQVQRKKKKVPTATLR